MKKIILAISILISANSFAQKKVTTKQDTIASKKDTLVVVTFKVNEYQALMSWIDNVDAPNKEVKAVEKLIYDRLKIIKGDK